jgi:voltage-gated sodium channel
MLAKDNKIEKFFESHLGHEILAIILVLNAFIFGLETFPHIYNEYGHWFNLYERLVSIFFMAELVMRVTAGGKRYLKDGWHQFDATIIIISSFPGLLVVSLFRSLRFLKLLRVISAFPHLHFLVQTLLKAMPRIFHVGLILVMFFIISSVFACHIFGPIEEKFKTLTDAMFMMYRLTVMDNWSDIVTPIMEKNHYALFFFIPYTVIMSYTILNLFFGLIVNSMQEFRYDEEIRDLADHVGVDHDEDLTHEKIIINEMKNMHQDVMKIYELLQKKE